MGFGKICKIVLEDFLHVAVEPHGTAPVGFASHRRAAQALLYLNYDRHKQRFAPYIDVIGQFVNF